MQMYRRDDVEESHGCAAVAVGREGLPMRMYLRDGVDESHGCAAVVVRSEDLPTRMLEESHGCEAVAVRRAHKGTDRSRLSRPSHTNRPYSCLQPPSLFFLLSCFLSVLNKIRNK